MYSNDKLFQRSREGYLGVYFPSCDATREINTQINTRVSAETVRDESTYIILFLTRHNESNNDDKNDDPYTLSKCFTHSVFVPVLTSQSIADDVTMTRQLWRNHVNSDI